MSSGMILFFVLLFIIIYVIIYSLITDKSSITTMLNGQNMTQISASSLTKSTTNASNFTYSVWFYVNDWNYRYGEPKVVFGRMGANSTSTTSGSVPGISGQDPCPSVVLGAIENDLHVSLACFAPSSGPPPPPTNPSDPIIPPNIVSHKPPTKNIIHTCKVSNIPIQKWVNLLISVYGRTLDVYIDGKLVRTCLLPGIANVNQNANLFLTPNGGFSGWTSRLQYWPNSTDPQTAWNIYTKGYGASVLGTAFGQYKVQVSVTKDGINTASLQI